MGRIFNQWITRQGKHPFYARKEITIDGTVQKAAAAVCGLGQFTFYVNGQKVGDRVLDPAWTDYNKVVHYVSFDIRKYLHPGKNVIAAEVGNGWYIMDTEGGYSFHFPEFMPPNPNPYIPFGKSLVLASHIEILQDDVMSVMDADETWKVAESAIQISNVYGSEVIDGRKKQPGWNTEDFDDSHWETAEIVMSEDEPQGLPEEQTIPGIKVLYSCFGEKIGTVNGKDIYDFGQNTSGMLSFEVKGKYGDEIHVYPAEKLGQDGDVDQTAKNWLDINVCDTYIIGHDDQWESYDMTFTYIGARYIALEHPGCKLRNIQLHAISSARETAGIFSCDDQRYMQIYDLVEKSVESNMLGVHTDCPTIERFAWQEENHLMAPSIMYMKRVKPHWEKFLKDTRLAQHKQGDVFLNLDGNHYPVGEGMIPSQAPCYLPNVLPVPGMGDFYDIIPWGSSIIIGTYWHYMFYGDRKIIEDNYDAGKRYLAYLKTKVNEEGFINHGLGDWGNPTGEYARENVETAFLYVDAMLLTKFARILYAAYPEKDVYRHDCDSFEEYAEQVKQNYNEKLMVYDNKNNRWCYRLWGRGDIKITQASEAIPLYWGMVPEERQDDIALSLKDAMLSAGCFQCGEVGQPYIIQSLSQYGMNDIIAELIVKDEHPSYYAFVLDGETSLGEYWEYNPRSHNHDMMGHIIEWFYNGMAGIKPLEPGFSKVLVKPYLPKSVNHLQAVYHSISGDIEVEIRRENGTAYFTVHADNGIAVETDNSYL